MSSAARRHLANLALYCYAVFIATVLAMPVLKDGYSPIDQEISEGAIGEHGAVQVMGFFALAAGASITAALLRAASRSAAVSATSGLMFISAAAVVVLAVFPTDAPDEDSAIGTVHAIAAGVAFITNISAMLWSAYAFRHAPAVARLTRSSLVLGSIAAVLLAMLATGIGADGVVQRATVLAEITWLTMLTFHLRGQALRDTVPSPATH